MWVSTLFIYMALLTGKRVNNLPKTNEDLLEKSLNTVQNPLTFHGIFYRVHPKSIEYY